VESLFCGQPMMQDANGRVTFERGDRVWSWFDSSGPPIKGTILLRFPPDAHRSECYGVFLDHVCPREGKRLSVRASWLLYSVFDPDIVRDYPLDALAEAANR
jgi:hypothetical protein